MATGSEVSLCLEAFETLKGEGIKVRVVSMPSWDIFEKQPADYKNKLLPSEVKARVSVEAGATFGWERYTGLTGAMIGLHSFGASAPLKELLDHFGLTPTKIAQAARDQIKNSGR
jgi:transketolase